MLDKPIIIAFVDEGATEFERIAKLISEANPIVIIGADPYEKLLEKPVDVEPAYIGNPVMSAMRKKLEMIGSMVVGNLIQLHTCSGVLNYEVTEQTQVAELQQALNALIERDIEMRKALEELKVSVIVTEELPMFPVKPKHQRPRNTPLPKFTHTIKRSHGTGRGPRKFR